MELLKESLERLLMVCVYVGRCTYWTHSHYLSVADFILVSFEIDRGE